MIKSVKIFLIVSFCILSIVLLNKSGYFELIGDVVDYGKVIFFWIASAVIILYALKTFLKRELTEMNKLIFWTVIMSLALFNWSMIKYDPYPTNGPIDSWLYKDKVERKRQDDSIEAVKYLESIKHTSEQFKLSEEFIRDTIITIDEVRDNNKYIDSVTNHKHGIALLIRPPERDEKDYWIQAGYNGELRFETHFNFYINPMTKQITIDEVVSGERLTLDEWRKQNKSNK